MPPAKMTACLIIPFRRRAQSLNMLAIPIRCLANTILKVCLRSPIDLSIGARAVQKSDVLIVGFARSNVISMSRPVAAIILSTTSLASSSHTRYYKGQMVSTGGGSSVRRQ